MLGWKHPNKWTMSSFTMRLYEPLPSLKSILAEKRAGLKPPAQCMEALRANATSRIYPTFMN